VLVEYGISKEILSGISLGDFKWYLSWRFQIISQRGILNNIPTWRYYQYKLIEIF